MPNLVPPVVTAADALAYRARILEAEADFEPLMTLYLTDRTSPDDLAEAKESGAVVAVKLYPQGATTNSDRGVSSLSNIDDALAAMVELDLVLCVHGEVTDKDVDVFDREAVFIERHLLPLKARHPDLKIVLEHITTAEGIDFVKTSGRGVAGTLTAHHLLLNRNALFEGGLNPHHYCLPILKAEAHREALVAAATSGDDGFFLGTDSAPHTRGKKECAAGCAGCYTSWHAMSLYAEAFDRVGALDRLADFASVFGARFYGLPQNAGTLRLERAAVEVPSELALGDEPLVPLLAGTTLGWRVTSRAAPQSARGPR